MGAWAGFGEGLGRVREYFGGVWEEFEGSFNGLRVDLWRVLARRPQRLPKLGAFEIPDALLIMLRLQMPVKRG